MSLALTRPEEIREVHAEAETLVRLHAVEFLVNRKQHAPFQAVSLVEQQDRRPDQHHPAAAVGNLLRSVSRAAGPIRHAFDEETHVGLRVFEAPRRWTIPV